jgi:hypothetical protein
LAWWPPDEQVKLTAADASPTNEILSRQVTNVTQQKLMGWEIALVRFGESLDHIACGQNSIVGQFKSEGNATCPREQINCS